MLYQVQNQYGLALRRLRLFGPINGPHDVVLEIKLLNMSHLINRRLFVVYSPVYTKTEHIYLSN